MDSIAQINYIDDTISSDALINNEKFVKQTLEKDVKLARLMDEEKLIIDIVKNTERKLKRIKKFISILNFLFFTLNCLNLTIPLLTNFFSDVFSKKIEYFIIPISAILLIIFQKTSTALSVKKEIYIEIVTIGNAAKSLFHKQINDAIQDGSISSDEYAMIIDKLFIAKNDMDKLRYTNSGVFHTNEYMSPHVRGYIIDEGEKLINNLKKPKVVV